MTGNLLLYPFWERGKDTLREHDVVIEVRRSTEVTERTVSYLIFTVTCNGVTLRRSCTVINVVEFGIPSVRDGHFPDVPGLNHAGNGANC